MEGLSFAGRSALALGCAVLGLRDPRRGDLIAVLGDATGGGALRQLRDRICESGSGRRMVETGYPVRFPEKSIADLVCYPDGTLGRGYGEFMRKRGFDPSERCAVYRELVQDERDAWVLQRYRDIHDLWHVVFELPTTLLGEVGLKWFEAFHTGLPVAVASATVGPTRLCAEQRKFLFQKLVPWAWTASKSVTELLAIKYEDHLDRQMDDLRREWRVVTPRDYLVDTDVLYKRHRDKTKL